MAEKEPKEPKEVRHRSVTHEEMASFIADLPFDQSVFLIGRPGIGKCLGLGTPVLLADGRVLPVEQIAAGDRVMGPDGKARNVLSTATGRGPLYRIDPIKGEPWVCNDVHMLTLVNSYSNEIVDVPLDQWLSASDRFRHDHKMFSTGVVGFDNALQKPVVDPYFLGVWFGDGTKEVAERSFGECLTKVQVSKPDREIRAICEETAKAWELNIRVSGDPGNPSYALSADRGQNNRLLRAVRDLVGPKIEVPDAVLRGDRATRLQFLAGFIDTDGELASNCFVVTQKREDWARAVWFIARSLDFCATITTRSARDQNGTEGTYHVVTISGYTDQIPTRIPRKRAHPREQKKDPARTGFAVTPIGDGDYFGFMLDGDGRFLLGDFTVTHNTAIANLVADKTPVNPDLDGEPVYRVTWDLGSRLPEDLLGLPFREGNATFFAPPIELEQLSFRGRRGILILDDLPNASQAVKIACYRLIHERRVGSLELSRGVRVITTGNRREDKSGATTLPAALRNRMMILEFEPDLEAWIKWYAQQNLPFEVAAFLKWKSEHFAKTPEDADKKGAYATPRAWHMVGQCLDAVQRHGMVLEGLGGLVGEGVAHEFGAFLAVKNQLPPAEDILDDPEKTVPTVPTKIDVLVAMMSTIAMFAAKSKKADMPGKLIKAVAYLSQNGREYAGVAIDAYWSGGGPIPKVSDFIRNNVQTMPLVKALLQHIQLAVRIS